MPEPGGAVVDSSLSDALATGNVVATLDVSLSNEIVHLLSEQLYTSPTKAIEELVVNSYDADASECRIALLFEGTPGVALVSGDDGMADSAGAEDDPVADLAVTRTIDITSKGLIAIYDDGEGMDLAGLGWLWRIGDSPKKDLIATDRFGRKTVGKFGIGKLATYAVASRITYLSASGGIVRYVLCDFRRFGPSSTGGASEPVKLLVREISNLSDLLQRPDFTEVLDRLGLASSALIDGTIKSWTLCLLDNLKPKAQDLKIGRLAWVLRTAMPLKTDFRIFLNGFEQKSSKEDYERIVEFKTGDLEEK